MQNEHEIDQRNKKKLKKFFNLVTATILFIIFTSIVISALQQKQIIGDLSDIFFRETFKSYHTTQTTKATPPQLFKLRIYLSDYSTDKYTGEAVGAKLTLYDYTGKIIATGTQSATPKSTKTGGQLSAGIDVSIPLGTYTYKAESERLQSAGTFTINSHTDPTGYTIQMKSKPMTIRSRLFEDANNNEKYDEGETFFSNSVMFLMYKPDENKERYIIFANSTTDNKGYFIFEFQNKWHGSYSVGSYPISGYKNKTVPAPRIYNLKGGDSIVHNVYMIPN